MSATLRITTEQILAARELREELGSWRSTDQALFALADRFPEFDLPACALKVVAVNSLYATNIYAVWRMAEHVREVMGASDRRSGPALVDEIASLGGRMHKSFASKFAHFFVDPTGFPIYDSYAAKALARHLGRRKIWPKTYSEFYGWCIDLRALHDPAFTFKDIDQYLWLSGMFRDWIEAGGKMLSGDVKALFQSTDHHVVSALQRLALDGTEP